jgi:hypothetical protein
MEVDEPPAAVDDAFEVRTVEVEESEPKVFDTELEDAELPPDFEEPDEGDERPRKPGWQRFARLIVPIAVALYILVSALVRNN